MKKIFSGIIAFILALILIVPAFADRAVTQTKVVSDSTNNGYISQSKYSASALKPAETFYGGHYVIPGVSQSYIPQGFAYYDGYFLISSYDKKGTDPSIIVAIDAITGEFVCQFNLYYSDGSKCKIHVGGLAVSENNLYITKDSGVMYVPLSNLDFTGVKSKKLVISGYLKLSELGSASTAYATFSEGVLWVGNFYYASAWLIGKVSWSVKAPSCNSVLLGFKLKGNTSAAEWSNLKKMTRSTYNVQIPDSIQGIQGAAVYKNRLYLSRTVSSSFGCRISCCRLNLTSSDITLSKDSFVHLTNLPGAENIVILDNVLYCIYESAALGKSGDITWNNAVRDETDIIWAMDLSSISHKNTTVTKKATLTSDGYTASSCVICGKTTVTSIIYRPGKFTLSASSFVCDGEVHKPAVKVVNTKGNQIPSSNYTVTVKNSEGTKKTKPTAVDNYTVTIKFSGNYSGSKTLSYTIKPEQVTNLKLKASGNEVVTISYDEVSEADKYQIQYKYYGDDTYYKLANTTKLKYTTYVFSQGDELYFRVRALTTDSNGKTIYGAWSKAKKITVK